MTSITPPPARRHARSRALVLTLLAVLLVLPAAPAGALDFTIVGRGNGHGIGLSQYGTQGQALQGRTAAQILATYYAGTSVASRPAPYPARIGVALDEVSIRLVVRGAAADIAVAGRNLVGADGSIWTVTVDGNGTCTTVLHPSTAYTGSCPELDPRSGGRIEVRTPASPSGWHIHHEYGRSSTVEVLADKVTTTAWRLDVVVELPLEEYLYGLAEMPYGWELAALQAQAIAGRSFATWKLLNGGSSPDFGCSCHLVDSQQDQVFKGWDRESTPNWDRWRTAVDSTATHVVLAPNGTIGTKNGIVQAFYSSSSNGRTEAKHEIWGGSVFPYLVSINDPWSLGSFNPHRQWEASVPPTTLAARVGLDAVERIEVVERSTSGAATKVRFIGRDGGSERAVEKTGSWVRQVLGLRSTTIDGVYLPPFTDDDGSVHENAIVWIANRDITRGCNPPDNDRFCPKKAVTRGQMAAFLRRALNLPAGNARFRDTAGSMFANDIDAIAAAGITYGCNPPTNDRFCPDAAVTREQMASFLMRALDLPAGQTGTFSDVRGGPHEHAVAALRKAGITQGCNPPSNDRYCPKDAVTREQMATFLARGLG